VGERRVLAAADGRRPGARRHRGDARQRAVLRGARRGARWSRGVDPSLSRARRAPRSRSSCS
jgi:hypothetical protein